MTEPMKTPDFGDVYVIALNLGYARAYVRPIETIGSWVIHVTRDSVAADDDKWEPFTLTHEPTGKRAGMYPTVVNAKGAATQLEELICGAPLGDFEEWLAASVPRRLRLAADLIEKFHARGLSSGMFFTEE